MLTRESKNFGKKGIPKENKKIFWSDPQDNTFNDINLFSDGVPYIVGGKTLLTCYHGPDLRMSATKLPTHRIFLNFSIQAILI